MFEAGVLIHGSPLVADVVAAVVPELFGEQGFEVIPVLPGAAEFPAGAAAELAGTLLPEFAAGRVALLGTPMADAAVPAAGATVVPGCAAVVGLPAPGSES